MKPFERAQKEKESEEEMIMPEEKENIEKIDVVNHPSHYTDGGIETIDFIDAKGLSYCLGNAVKYISRAGKKDPSKTIEDLRKAAWYLEHEIKRLQGQEFELRREIEGGRP